MHVHKLPESTIIEDGSMMYEDFNISFIWDDETISCESNLDERRAAKRMGDERKKRTFLAVEELHGSYFPADRVHGCCEVADAMCGEGAVMR